MEKVNLSIERLNFLKKRKKWRVYLIIHIPTNDGDIFIISPHQEVYKLTKHGNREININDHLLTMPVPENGMAQATAYIYQSRDTLRRAAEVIAGKGDMKLLKIISTAIQLSAPAIVVSKLVAGLIVNSIKNSKDRHLATIQMDEYITSQTIQKSIKGGFVELTYKWQIIK